MEEQTSRDTMKQERVDARENPRHPTASSPPLRFPLFPHHLVIPLALPAENVLFRDETRLRDK